MDRLYSQLRSEHLLWDWWHDPIYDNLEIFLTLFLKISNRRNDIWVILVLPRFSSSCQLPVQPVIEPLLFYGWQLWSITCLLLPNLREIWSICSLLLLSHTFWSLQWWFHWPNLFGDWHFQRMGILELGHLQLYQQLRMCGILPYLDVWY